MKLEPLQPEAAPIALTQEACWLAVVNKDASADGRFFYAVRTTGVYCRPSCGARLPRRENVSFHATAAEAEQAGFRPCKRCRPDEPPRRIEAVTRACRMLEESDASSDLTQLAARVGLSAYHFHRLFKSVTGMTPKAYAKAHRARRVRDTLHGAVRVTDAVYDAGYGSSAAFYQDAPGALGMAPRTYRAGGPDTAIRFAVAQCSLGAILVAATDRGVCAILLGDEPDALVRDLEDRFPRARLVGADARFEATVAQVIAFVEAPQTGIDLPLDIRGTAFQQRVWRALREIPAGHTVSYTELAQRLGMPSASRAVASACAANPLAVAVPCHRVVRRDGGLSGYRWGIERKRELLAREQPANE